jgi:hypothetical protein
VNRSIIFSAFTLNPAGDTISVDEEAMRRVARAIDRRTGNNWMQHYLGGLVRSAKHAPSTVAGNYYDDDKLQRAMQKGRDDVEELGADDFRAAAKELAIRRSCKYGIEYVLSLEGNAMIHYVMDGMDMMVVAQKLPLEKTIERGGAQITFRKISICTTELRYLFRNWGRIGPTGRVAFYVSFAQIANPWTYSRFGASAQWAAYAEHLVAKTAGSNLGTASERADFARLYAAKSYDAAIAKFHAMMGAAQL